MWNLKDFLLLLYVARDVLEMRPGRFPYVTEERLEKAVEIRERVSCVQQVATISETGLSDCAA